MIATDADDEARYQAVCSRDRRFDGVFYTAVSSTGIYCRPSCPARTPARANVTFHPTAASAQAAGYRACKRCLPDATPGSPRWDVAADAAGRAMRLIADGVVEREGVEGLAARLGYSTRHLTRLLTTQLGAGPLALARAQRAQNARTLVETSGWRLGDIAYASGFASVRQFNDTFREVYATTPSALRRTGPGARVAPGELSVRLPVRTPFRGGDLLGFLAARAIPGVEAAGPDWYARTLTLPHGPATVRLELTDLEIPGTAGVACRLRLSDLRDLAPAVERCRRLVDADADPVAVDTALTADPRLAPLVARRPGLRVPGQVDGHEIAVRAVLGQQVTVAAATRLVTRLVDLVGAPLPEAMREDGLDRLFPTPSAVASVDPSQLPVPGARARALIEMAAAVAGGSLHLDRSLDRADVRRSLTALPGVGVWTADYIALRALGDPDVFLPTDAGVRRALASLGRQPLDEVRPDTWRPWRSYALMHLWTHDVLDRQEGD